MPRLATCLLTGMILVALGTAVWAVAATPTTVPTPPAIEQILDSRCGNCHSRGRIEAARTRGEDIVTITSRMEGLGAILTAEERTAIMTFWGPALKTESPAPPKTTVSEAEAVINARCLQCHTRARIDQAIAAQLPFATMEAIMLKRGVVLNEKESGALKIFWGSPLAK